MADEIRLVDLEVIKRYSLAVRQESAPAEDLLAAIDASRAAIVLSMDAMTASAERAKPKPARRSRAKRAATS